MELSEEFLQSWEYKNYQHAVSALETLARLIVDGYRANYTDRHRLIEKIRQDIDMNRKHELDDNRLAFHTALTGELSYEYYEMKELQDRKDKDMIKHLGHVIENLNWESKLDFCKLFKIKFED